MSDDKREKRHHHFGPFGNSADDEPEALVGGDETVLVAEDESMVRELVVQVLTTVGYTVLAAEDGEAAWELYRQNRDNIDLLLTDIIMPRRDGKALSDLIRADRPNIPTVFMSGYTNEIIAKHGVIDAEVLLVEKPFSLEQLTQAVRKALDSLSN